MPISHDSALAALAQIKHPDLGRPITELNMVDEVRVEDAGKVIVALVLTSPSSALKARLLREVEGALTGAGAASVEITSEVRVIGRDITSEDPIPEVKNVVLV